MSKIGRNERCPCGSGVKYKRCHGNLARPSEIVMQQRFGVARARAEARQIELQRQHGRGRSPISLEVERHRIVAVGPRLHWSEAWKTFPDFLFDYYKLCLGHEWWMA